MSQVMPPHQVRVEDFFLLHLVWDVSYELGEQTLLDLAFNLWNDGSGVYSDVLCGTSLAKSFLHRNVSITSCSESFWSNLSLNCVSFE